MAEEIANCCISIFHAFCTKRLSGILVKQTICDLVKKGRNKFGHWYWVLMAYNPQPLSENARKKMFFSSSYWCWCSLRVCKVRGLDWPGNIKAEQATHRSSQLSPDNSAKSQKKEIQTKETRMISKDSDSSARSQTKEIHRQLTKHRKQEWSAATQTGDKQRKYTDNSAKSQTKETRMVSKDTNNSGRSQTKERQTIQPRVEQRKDKPRKYSGNSAKSQTKEGALLVFSTDSLAARRSVPKANSENTFTLFWSSEGFPILTLLEDRGFPRQSLIADNLNHIYQASLAVFLGSFSIEDGNPFRSMTPTWDCQFFYEKHSNVFF